MIPIFTFMFYQKVPIFLLTLRTMLTSSLGSVICHRSTVAQSSHPKLFTFKEVSLQMYLAMLILLFRYLIYTYLIVDAVDAPSDLPTVLSTYKITQASKIHPNSTQSVVEALGQQYSEEDLAAFLAKYDGMIAILSQRSTINFNLTHYFF